jgi:hypothetical protein
LSLGGTGIAVSLHEGKVLNLTIWRVLLKIGAEDQDDKPHTRTTIGNELHALCPDPQADEFHTSDAAQLTVTWPERASDSCV